MNEIDLLRRITSALEQAEIPFMLVGSFAAMYYSEPRATQDIDIVIAPTVDQLKALIALLPPGQYYADLETAMEALKRHSMFNVIDMATGWKVDLIMRKRRSFDEEAFRRRIPVSFEGIALYFESVEDTIVSKLEWSRLAQSARQIEHVAVILKIRWDSLDHAYLETWIGELKLSAEWDEACRAAGVS